nr:hypothetical protein [Gemmatimonadota bacterium]
GSVFGAGGVTPSFQIANNGSFHYQFNTDLAAPGISVSASVPAANAASRHNNEQPYVAVNHIIRHGL